MEVLLMVLLVLMIPGLLTYVRGASKNPTERADS